MAEPGLQTHAGQPRIHTLYLCRMQTLSWGLFTHVQLRILGGYLTANLVKFSYHFKQSELGFLLLLAKALRDSHE